MIENGDIIKLYEVFMDVAFEVHYAYGSGDVIVSGHWMNQGFTKSWYCPVFKNSRDRAAGKLELCSFTIKAADMCTNGPAWSIRAGIVALEKCDWEAVA